jgi:ABC-type polysaccharide/polyol phosphate transport system ATPase subunit
MDLLRLLAAIFKPDGGSIEVNGQISSMLELGDACNSQTGQTSSASRVRR